MKTLLEDINVWKNGQEETRRGQQEMQEKMEKDQQEMQERREKGQQEEETKKGLKNLQKSQEETKKGQEELKNTLENKIVNVEEKINTTEFELPIKCSGSSVRPEILQGLRTSINGNKTLENRRKLAEICIGSRKARQLGFLRSPSNCAKNNILTAFRGWPEGGEIQKVIRMADVQDLKSALKLEAATQASHRDGRSLRGARVTLDASCEFPWKSDIEK
ncbi:hypothetical protein TNCV_2591171 [Trichonephila clavipes]|nr:hypothetical protein TNCV_2591171 [Trichonephila clavipes]